MDENYLDNLLNEISLDKELDHGVEGELDTEMQKEKDTRRDAEKPSREDLFHSDLEQDADLTKLEDDLHFSVEQMNELDNLGDLADLDIGDLDFSDIDFDDLDVTRLNETEDGETLDALLKAFDGDLEIADHFEEPQNARDGETVSAGEAETSTEELTAAQTKEHIQQETETEPSPVTEDEGFDADRFLDGLLRDEEAEQAERSKESEKDFEDEKKQPPEELHAPDSEDADLKNTGGQQEEESLEDLFSLLDAEEDAAAAQMEPEISAEPAQTEQLPDAEEDAAQTRGEKGEKPAKKNFMTLLFGEPDDEDELSPEEVEALEQKKAAKKAKKAAAKKTKQEKKAAAQAEKAAKSGQKKKSQNEKKRVKAVKKAKRREEERANAEPEKPLNRPAVVFIFTLVIGGAAVMYLAANNFNYRLAIQNASAYFEGQKYHRAYDEIKGVDVKEEDQKLKDRIYTVMYVERLYESYENNLKMNRQKKALDSLLRGVSKYYEYYDEANKLGITEDLNYSFSQIQTALSERYGISLEQAVAINALENDAYVQEIGKYVQEDTGEQMTTQSETE